MSEDNEFAGLDDPAFLAERRRILTQVQETPEDQRAPELTRRYRAAEEEFLRRARIAWQQAS